MILENIPSQEIVQKLGWTLLHFVWQAAAVASLLGILLAVLRNSSANVRYIIACATLGLIILLPIVTMQLVSVSTPEPVTSIESQPAYTIVPAQTTIEEVQSTGAIEYKEPVQLESTDIAQNVSWKQRAVERLEPALPYLVTGWLLGVFGLSLWHLGGWAQLQRLKKQMVKRVNGSLQVKLNELSGKLKVKQAVQLLESALVQVPMVVGWLRPVILLPASALTGLTAEQLEALLAHELAHIRRYDYLVNMLQTVVETLGFYHPAVWWVSHRIRVERENCCDDLAVSISSDRVRYARALTSMEEIRGRSGELAVTATGGNFFSRIRRLIGKDSAEKTFSWIPAVTVILLLVALIISTTLALTTNEKNPTAEFITNKPENERPIAEKIDSNTKILIATQIVHVNNESLKQIGLDAASLKNSNPWIQYRVDNSSNSSMFVIDSSKKDMLLKTIEESGDSPSISRIFMMTMSGRETIIKNNNGYDFKSQELGRFIKIKPESSKDGKKVNVNCELTMRQFKNLDLFFDVYINKKVDQNDVSESEVVEHQSNAGNALLSDDRTLLILGGKLVSLQDVENGTPILKNIPVIGEFVKTTSKVKVEKNEIILIKTSIVRHEQSYDVDSKASSNNVFTIVDSKTNELLRIYFDLNLSEAGQYVEIKDSGKRESTLKQVATGDIGKSGKDFPAYAGYIEFEIRSNFDLNLATKRYTKGTLFEHDKWDAYFTGPDTIVGDGNFSPTTLCVSTWGLKLYRLAAVDDDIIPSLVAVIIKPNNEQQEKSDVEVEKKNQQLNKILEKFSVGSTVDETATDSKSIRESVENYIAAALAGDSKKTVEYTYPGSSVAAQTSYIYQALQGQNIRIVGMCIDKWNSWAISSAIKADQGRIGSIVFELRKVILEKKVLWLIDEIDLNKIDSIGEQIHYFIKVYPDAKTIIINPDTYTQKQTNERLDEKPQEKSSNPSLEKEGSSNNLPVKSPAPSAEDKSIVKVDLSVIEVPSDSKMDRETIVEIKNLLGGKITIPDSPAAGDLLRKAAGATEAVEDESADDKRVTQEKFNILLDLLVSRGYVKILMRPTLEVVDGETAQIISGQKIPRDRGALPTTQSDNKKTETEYEDVTDSIKITPHVSKDNNIILLQLEAVFSSLTMPHDDEKTPIVNRHETATLVRLGPGESGIISGTKQAGLITEPGKDVKDSELPATEIFVILTPAIVGSIEPKEPTETVNFENVEVRTIIEKLAEWSGKVVIPTADLMKQKITIQTPQQLSRSEAVALILNSLRSNGYTVEQTDETIFIKHVKDEILIDTKILTASDEFLKYIGLDPNSAASSDGWSEYLVNSSDDSASFVIDQLHTDLILKATTIHKDARGLCSPQVLALSGKKFEIHMTDSEHYMLIGGPPDSNVFSVEPESESNPIELGTTIRMIPTLTPDGKNIELDFEWEYRRLRGFKEHTNPGEKVQKVPQIDVDSIKTSCNVPDGKTLLIAGKKIIEQKKKEARKPQLADLPLLGRLFYSPPQPEQTKNLLIMVTPSTDIKAWPIPQSLVDPNDPLIKKLEEKFNHSDETKQVITPVDSN